VAQAIIGLGNPGPEYRNTRHNVGQRVVDEVARRTRARLARHGRHQVAQVEWAGEIVHLIKPACFMNVSGPAVVRLAQALALDAADLIIVFDDLDLALGVVRVRTKGSAGGHNGVRSIIESLGTDVFRRIKVGIGRPAPPGQHKDLIVDHVLSPFFSDELDVVADACGRAADLALELVEARAAPAR